MSRLTARRRYAVAGAAVMASAVTSVVFVATSGTSSAAGKDDGLAYVRDVTARYKDVANAKADGFEELKDAAGIACIDKTGSGGMGIHYVLKSRVGDVNESADQPELVIYEPQKNGKLKLVAAEYVVVADAWAKAGHSGAPSLFGQSFNLVGAPNRYGLPAFYELHAWAWDHNSSGGFADYNPKVVCPVS